MPISRGDHLSGLRKARRHLRCPGLLELFLHRAKVPTLLNVCA
jgi:hypothetical protein